VAAGWDLEARQLRAYPWGDAPPDGRLGLGLAAPEPVGTTPGDRSPFGLLDLGGGVCEWVVRVGASPPCAVKGASFAVDARTAAHQARVRVTGTPRPTPPPLFEAVVGVRLLVDAPEETP